MGDALDIRNRKSNDNRRYRASPKPKAQSPKQQPLIFIRTCLPLKRRCRGGERCTLSERWSHRAFDCPRQFHGRKRWDRVVRYADWWGRCRRVDPNTLAKGVVVKEGSEAFPERAEVDVHPVSWIVVHPVLNTARYTTHGMECTLLLPVFARLG